MGALDNLPMDTPRDEVAAALREEYLSDLPASLRTIEVAGVVFRKAWEDGHASGLHEVEQHYAELAEIARLAYQAGRTQ